MDILAARKKAAEKAKAVSARKTEPDLPASKQRGRAEPAPAFPPLPETALLSDEPATATELISQPSQESEDAADAAPTPAAVPEAEPEPKQEPPPQREISSPAATAVAARALELPVEEQALEMLSFLLGSEEYVVPVERVREILTPKEITPVPRTADYLIGVCSLRGTVMPVIDLNRRLGLGASGRDEKSRIVVVSLGRDDQVGLYVDRVRGVVRFLPSAVRPAPETVAQSAGAEFLKGIARKDDRLYILLDVEKAIGA
jgi:purine-binding chemotaxis protein CheW